MVLVLTLVLGAILASILKDFNLSLFGFKLKWPINDKVSHFFGAGCFAFLFTVFTYHRLKIKNFSINTSIVLLIVFSILEETTQLLRPNRGFDFFDMLANVFGILFCAFGAEQALKKQIIIR
ncbi:MAG: VanZ family protein [Bacteroidia bacterium]